MQVNAKSKEFLVLEIDFILGTYEIRNVIFALIYELLDFRDHDTELLLGKYFVDEIEKLLQGGDFFFSGNDKLLDNGRFGLLLLVLVVSWGVMFYGGVASEYFGHEV